MGDVFRTSRRVEFADTDMAGIAHFSAFFRWMEAAEHELLRSLGHTVFRKLDDGARLSFPRVNATCDYRSPTRCEEVLDVAVTVDRLGAKSITYAFTFTFVERLIAEGKVTSVCCRFAAGGSPEPRPLPPELVDGLRPFTAK